MASWLPGSLSTPTRSRCMKTPPTKIFTSFAAVEVETTLNGTQVVKGEGEVSSDGKKISVRLGGRGVVYE